MGKRIVIKLNSQGARNFLRSNDMMSICESYAGQMAKKLGAAYKVSKYRGVNRVNASVYTDDPSAILDNLNNNTMLKQLGVKLTAPRTGKIVKGYYRKLKNGKTIFVQGYQRRK